MKKNTSGILSQTHYSHTSGPESILQHLYKLRFLSGSVSPRGLN